MCFSYLTLPRKEDMILGFSFNRIKILRLLFHDICIHANISRAPAVEGIEGLVPKGHDKVTFEK